MSYLENWKCARRLFCAGSGCGGEGGNAQQLVAGAAEKGVVLVVPRVDVGVMVQCVCNGGNGDGRGGSG